MNIGEFYRYQTDVAPRKISINAYCISEGVEYRNFIKWYRDNKKRLRESEMEEIPSKRFVMRLTNGQPCAVM